MKDPKRAATRAFRCLLGGLALLAASPLLAQQELFFENVDVSVANIEVIVTDSEGQPATGLSKEDFEVFEDGQPVELTNFFAVEDRKVDGVDPEGLATEIGAIGEHGEEASALISSMPAGPETRQLFLVIYVDNLNIEPVGRNRAFGSLRTFLRDRLQEGDQVMIVSFDGGLEISQKFTDDPAKIEASLQRLEKQTSSSVVRSAERDFILRQISLARLVPRPQGDLGVSDFTAAQQVAIDLVFSISTYIDRAYDEVVRTTRALERFTGSLAGLPGRKAILYLSDGIPSRVGEPLVQAWQNKFEFWASNNLRDEASSVATLQNLPRSTNSAFRRLIDEASAQKVAFYPISNPRSSGSAISAQSGGGSSSDSGAGAYSNNVKIVDSFNREISLLWMAEGTGGAALTRSSNMAELLDRMVRDFSTFYSLGYTPRSPGDGAFHRVEVKVRKPGLKVRHVRGHRQVDPTQQMENLTLSALFYDFESNPLGASLASGQYNETVGGKYRVPVLLKIPFQNLILLPQANAYAGRLMAYVIVQDAEGNLSPFQHILLPIEVPNERYEQAMQQDMAYLMDLVMEKGQHRVSIGIRDEIAKIESTVYLDVSIGQGNS